MKRRGFAGDTRRDDLASAVVGGDTAAGEADIAAAKKIDPEVDH